MVGKPERFVTRNLQIFDPGMGTGGCYIVNVFGAQKIALKKHVAQNRDARFPHIPQPDPPKSVYNRGYIFYCNLADN